MKPLDYYPIVEDIFTELSGQSKTKIAISASAKEINHSIVEPLTDQEKEEDYEVHLHISIFTSKDRSTEEQNPLHIEKVPIEQQENVPIEQKSIVSIERNTTVQTQQPEEGGE